MQILPSSLRPLHVAFVVLAAAACGGSTTTTESPDAGGNSHNTGSASGSKSSGTASGSGTAGSTSPSATGSSGATSPTTSGSVSGTQTTSGSNSVATTTGSGANTCNTLTPTTTAKLSCGSGAQPTFTGGTITPGSYVVSTVEIYEPDGGMNICALLGDVIVKGAGSVTASKIQLVLNLSGILTKSISIDGTYAESGNMLTVTPTCGAASSSVETVEYTATGTSILIDAQIMGYTGIVTLVPAT